MRHRALLVSAFVALALGDGCVGPSGSSAGGGGSSKAPRQAAPGEIAEVQTPFAREVPAQVRAYLERVHHGLHEAWSRDVVLSARYLLPPDHPANKKGLAVQVEMHLDERGGPGPVKVMETSGYRPFDESAARVLSSVAQLPPLPRDLDEGHVFLSWRFFNDRRCCCPALARLRVVPLTRPETLQRSIGLKDFVRARRILLEHDRDQEALLAVLVQAGLEAEEPDVQRAALELARTEQLVQVCHSRPELRAEAVSILVQRKATGALLDLLGEVQDTVPGQPAPRPDRAQGTADLSAWEVVLLDGLAGLEAEVPQKKAQALLDAGRPAVARAAAALVRSKEAVQAALSKWRADSAMAGPLALRLWHLGAREPAQEALQQALGSKEPVATLQALSRWPAVELADQVQPLLDKAHPLAVRLMAIEALGRIQSDDKQPLYRALQDDRPEIQMAAARALAQRKAYPMGTSYRLAVIAYKGRGKVEAEALAALALLGVGRFAADVMRLQRLLAVEDQVKVVAALHGFGDAAVPTLARLLTHPREPVVLAARESLQRIGTEAAQRALSRAKAPTAQDRHPLLQLIQLALSARKP